MNIQQEKLQRNEVEIKDAHNDEHWLKKYGVSLKEAVGKGNKSISAKIIEATSKDKRSLAL